LILASGCLPLRNLGPGRGLCRFLGEIGAVADSLFSSGQAQPGIAAFPNWLFQRGSIAQSVQSGTKGWRKSPIEVTVRSQSNCGRSAGAVAAAVGFVDTPNDAHMYAHQGQYVRGLPNCEFAPLASALLGSTGGYAGGDRLPGGWRPNGRSNCFLKIFRRWRTLGRLKRNPRGTAAI
jgi:hypothetical protein